MPPPIPIRELEEILSATAPLWPELRNQRLFLTGGTGFFGAWLVESFLHINQSLALDAHLTVLTRTPTPSHYPALTYLEGDIRHFAFPSGDYAYVIHAATSASAKQLAEAPDEMASTILEGTQNILRFAAAAQTKKLLFTSSGAVYGTQTELFQEEENGVTNDHSSPDEELSWAQSLHPATIYGQSKLAAERLLTQAPCQAKIARCFAFLGPHLPLDTHFAAGNFLRDALASNPIHIASDGRALRSYLYPTDLVIWLWTLLFQAPALRPYNVGSDRPISIAQLAETIRAEVNPTIAINIAQPTSDTPPHRYVPSIARAATELNLHPTVSLEEAIRRTAAWHRLK